MPLAPKIVGSEGWQLSYVRFDFGQLQNLSMMHCSLRPKSTACAVGAQSRGLRFWRPFFGSFLWTSKERNNNLERT
jgi:hypothetical protein